MAEGGVAMLILAVLALRRWRRRRAPKANVVIDRFGPGRAVFARYPGGTRGRRRYR